MEPYNTIAICSTALFTVLIFFVAYLELKKISKISKFDFMTHYEEGFFDNKNFIKIINAVENKTVENKTIEFINNDKDNNIPYFKIHSKNNKTKDITTTEMDYFFGYFETLGFLQKKNVVALDSIDVIFGYYIKKLWELLKEEYLDYCRKELNGEDTYIYFECLYKKILHYENKKIKC